jgi:glycosyltransferase involved in cell wall biosynthesis
MKVLLVNDGARGGSIVAMMRLHQGLKKVGVESKILNRVNRFQSPDVVSIPRSRKLAWAEYQLARVTWRLGLNDIHCLNTFSLKQVPAYLDADVLDFHTIHGGFFNYLALPSLTREKPGVLTLHDMWFFTGHCSYSYDCERWKTGCGKCPHLDAYPAVRRDRTRLDWKLKHWAYGKSKLAVVSPGKWLTQQAKQSMLNELPIHHIPHGIDTEVYRPLDRDQCRSVLGIPRGKRVLMFMSMTMDPTDAHYFRKGCDLLLAALKALPESIKTNTVLLLVGEGGDAFGAAVNIETISLDYVASDRLKAIAYSASDLFIFPTRADIFGLVLLESMACGTPMVSFDVGGVSELVRPGVTGYLAAPENVHDFRGGILELLEKDRMLDQMRQRCREIAVKEYPVELQVQSYIKLYRELLNEPGPAIQAHG